MLPVPLSPNDARASTLRDAARAFVLGSDAPSNGVGLRGDGQPGPLTRWLFFRALGCLFVIAFGSLALQVDGLVGEHGLAPVAEGLSRVEDDGWRRFLSHPTLSWWDMSGTAFLGQCVAGGLLGVALVIGFAPRLICFLLWILWLSVNTAGGVFLARVSDLLLLEVVFAAILLAPAGWRPRAVRREPPRIVLFLLRWILFRLMFLSGWTKLFGNDPAWRDGTAVAHHYATQPNPGWLAYWASHSPAWLHGFATYGTLVVEVLVPLLIFGPRRAKQFAFWSFAAFQLCLLLTGNYGYFNLTSLALGLLLLDDRAVARWLPRRIHAGVLRAGPAAERPGRSWRGFVGLTAAGLVALSSFLFVHRIESGVSRLWPARSEVPAALWLLHPLQLVNNYAPFCAIRRERIEIVLSGSEDGEQWREYECGWRPGRLDRAPRFYRPHMPRLDWQMWLTDKEVPQPPPWYGRLLERLLSGSDEVAALFASNPFPQAPPRYIRAELYRYAFTSLEELRSTGNYWQRERIRSYHPVVTLTEGHVALAELEYRVRPVHLIQDFPTNLPVIPKDF